MRAFSPDGGLLAVVRGDDLVLYDTTSWAERGRAPSSGVVTALQFSPDGRHLLVSDDSAEQTKEGAAEPPPSARLSAYTTADLSLMKELRQAAYTAPPAFLRDGRVVVPIEEGSRQRLETWRFDLETKTSQLFPEKDARVTSLVVGSTGHLAFGFGSTLQVLLAGTSQPVLNAEYDSDHPPVFSPDGERLAFRRVLEVDVWTETGNGVRSLRDPDCTGEGIAFSPDGKTLAVGGRRFNVCLFDTTTGRLKGTLPSTRVRKRPLEDEGTSEPMGWSPDQRTLVVRGRDEFLLYDLPKKKRHVLGFTLDDAQIFNRSRDRALIIAQRGIAQARVDAGGRLVVMDRSEGSTTQLDPSPDGEYFARRNERFELVSTDGKNEPIRLERSEALDQTEVLLFDPRSRFAMTRHYALRIWDTKTGKLVGPKPKLDCKPTPVAEPRVEEAQPPAPPEEPAGEAEEIPP